MLVYDVKARKSLIVAALIAILICVFLIVDVDSDLLPTYREIFQERTNPFLSDSDSDGLRDDREEEYKTNPSVADTDGDGLVDGDEVLVYDTNPLSRDSDSDSLEDLEEIELGTSPTNPDTDGDGLFDLETFPLKSEQPYLDMRIGKMELTRGNWQPIVKIEYEILADNHTMSESWIFNSTSILNSLRWDDFQVRINGEQTSVSPELFTIEFPLDLEPDVNVTVQYHDESHSLQILASQQDFSLQSINEHWLANEMPLEKSVYPTEAVDSMQSIFDDYAMVISGFIMMERHLQDLKRSFGYQEGWASDIWRDMWNDWLNSITPESSITEVLNLLQNTAADHPRIEELKRQVRKVWIDIQALRSFPWDYLDNYPDLVSSYTSEKIGDITNVLMSSVGGNSFWIAIEEGVEFLERLTRRMCSEYFNWINEVGPVETVRYIAGNAKWYLDNLNEIRKVEREKILPYFEQPVELLHINGELVVPWFPAFYAFSFSDNWNAYKATPFFYASTHANSTFDLREVHITWGGLPLGSTKKEGNYWAFIITESVLQRYLEENGFYIKHLPPTPEEKEEITDFRAVSKFLVDKLDNDEELYLSNSTLSEYIKTIASCFSSFDDITPALSVVREHETVETFLAELGLSLWRVTSENFID